MIAAVAAWACGKLQSDRLYPWQLIYLTAGLATVATSPFVYYFLDSDIDSARFFDENEKKLAYERLRANQTGAGSYVFKWSQCLECFMDPKTYLWMSMSCLLNIGASVTGAFGPTLINNFGFPTSITSLLNIPFGFLQFLVTLGVSFFALKAKMKSPIMLLLLLPVLAGLGMLYSQGVAASPSQAVSLAGYYLLGILFGGNTIIVSWMIANTAGQTKKTVLMVCYNIGSSIGNIVGPLLFNARDRPTYLPGIRAVLGIFIALFAIVIGQTALLYFYNVRNQRKRVAMGKPKHIVDTSMTEKYQQYGEHEGGHLGDHALEDNTDLNNEEFLYVY